MHDSLLAHLRSFFATAPVGGGLGLVLAYSGGLDSTVLLHALVDLKLAASSLALRTIHIDHQLHPGSGRWAEQCVRESERLDVPCVVERVVVARAAQGVEAAAREARYAALRSRLRPGEVLLTAQHADDQLETMLLALLRGAGVRGLGAMRPWQRFEPGWLARPLLTIARETLRREAERRALSWIDDPANEDVSLDRSYLRQRVIPLLRTRWPAAAQAAARTSAHLHDAEDSLGAVAAADLANAALGDCIDLARFKMLEPARRRHVLRLWIRRAGARAPNQRKLATIDRDICAAREDRLPRLAWDDMEIRRYRGLLYCRRALPDMDRDLRFAWNTHELCELPGGLGRLRMEAVRGEGLAPDRLGASVEVRFRAGGESFRPSGDAHHRTLKKLLQSANVLPWWRERLPLVYVDGALAAVADLWVADDFAARGDQQGRRIVWDGRPPLHAQNAGTLPADN
jgi:tRNA(Ile)-lysidine synthase